MNMSVAGTEVWVYGSTGPGHANFTLQFDGNVITKSASSPQTQFQQLLYHYAFPPGSPSPHFVSLTARLSGDGVQGGWLDFDYITISQNASDPNPSSTSAVVQLPTLLPPWATHSSSAAASPSALNGAASGSNADAPSPSSSHSSKIPIILSGLFGGILLIILLLAFIYFLLKRSYDTRRSKERHFRYGARTAGAPSISATTQTHTDAGAGGAMGYAATSPPPSPGFGTLASEPTLSDGYGYNYSDRVVVIGSGGQDQDKEGDWSSAKFSRSSSQVAKGVPRPLPPAPTGSSQGGIANTPFAFLSQAPISFQFGKMKRDKGDGDSLKTDFLQV